MQKLTISLLTFVLSLSFMAPVDAQQRSKHQTTQSKPVVTLPIKAAATDNVPVPVSVEVPTPRVPEIMPLSEVEVGMEGYGLSVFQGTKPERFGFKVTGFVRNIKDYETILVDIYDLHGDVIKNAHIIAGMSGSPMLIGDRIIGALAFGGQFPIDSWALVTPIEHMLSWPNSLNEPNKNLLSQDRPRTIGNNKSEELGLGDSYCYFLTWGDISLVATATVTYVDYARGYIYSQGHTGLGGADKIALPFGKSRVFKTVPMLDRSYKMAEPVGPMLGTIVLDNSWGQIGKFGVFPRSIPLSVRIEGVLETAIVSNSNVAYLPQTAAYVGAIIRYLAKNNIDRTSGSNVTARIALKGRPEIFISDRIEPAIKSINEIVESIVSDPDHYPDIESVQVTVKPESQEDSYQLMGAKLLKPLLDGRIPLRLTVQRASDGSKFERVLNLEFPVDSPLFGQVLTASDGATLQSKLLVEAPLSDVLSILDKLRHRQLLYFSCAKPGSETIAESDNHPGWQKKTVGESLAIIFTIDVGIEINGSADFLLVKELPVGEPDKKASKKKDKQGKDESEEP